MSSKSTGGRSGRRRHRRLPAHLAEAGDRAVDGYAYEANVLVSHAADAAAIRQRLDELGVSVTGVEHLAGLSLERLRLDTKRPVPEIVDALRDAGDPPVRVAPDHVLGSCSHAAMAPVTAPRPAPALAPLWEQPDLPGAGVRVGVLDTGAVDHPYFGGRCDLRPEDVDQPDADGDGKLDHDAGHGTFIAGLVLRHAPRATIVARRLSYEPSEAPRPSCVTDTRLAQQLMAHDDLRRVDVLVLSLGGYTHDGMGLIATEAALRDYLASNPDVVIVAAAGNDARSDPFFPAAYKFVVGVGALDGTARRPACFSNRGWWVDAAAIGEGVHSTFVTYEGKLAPHPRDAPPRCEGVLPDPPAGAQDFDGWAQWDGTSFAAPRVAAAIAARLGGQRHSADAVYEVLHAPGTSRVPGLGTVVNPRGYP